MSDTPAAPPADTEVVARVRGASKSYPGVRALDRADFEIRAGEVRALLGRNGAGKSTLIRLLSGVEAPDEGEIEIGGRPLGPAGGIRRAAELGVGTVYQELSLVPELSAAENLYLGAWPTTSGRIDYGRIRAGAEEVFAELGVAISPDTRVGELPLAQRQLVEIARAFRARPRLLILDEPTSALAAGEAETVLEAVGRVSARGVGVVYVSHRLDEIRRVADTVTVMRDGAVVETTPVRGATTRHIVSLMLGHGGGEEAVPRRRAPSSRAPLLSVRDLAVPPKVDGVSFDLRPGEVLGLGGLMGSGRTEILRALAGFTPSRGTIEVDGSPVARPTSRTMKRLGVGITPEDRKGEGVVPLLGVSENMVMTWFGGASRAGAVLPSRVSGIGRDLIDRLSIKAAATDTPIVNLSGGNQQKAVIGRWLHAGSRILLLDEPTRGVDVEAKAQIYAIVRDLAERGAAVLFVSSELEELPLVCDRVLALRGGRLQGEFTGDDITLDNIMAAAMAA
jgi:simple sugar transport system ATP-binding protein